MNQSDPSRLSSPLSIPGYLTKFLTTRSSKRGMPPGTLIHLGERRLEKSFVTLTLYNEKEIIEISDPASTSCIPDATDQYRTWIHINGLHQISLLEELGNNFGIHPLTLEDVLNTDQRPRIEDNETYLYIVVKMLFFQGDSEEVFGEQVSIILGNNFVLSFQESDLPVFHGIFERLKNSQSRVRRERSDFLAYALFDTVVDDYFVVLEKMADWIEDLEEDLLDDPSTEELARIQSLKREVLYVRKSLWPIRETLSKFERIETPLIHKTTRIYLRDVYDHAIQAVETVDSFRDMLIGMLDIYLSSVSFKMNRVMKVLTVITTIFMPLTLITGIYGMNFIVMPGGDNPHGFYLTLGLMATIAGTMSLFFWRNDWF